jgi:hypothetical protein
MRRIFLTGVAALLLATGTAHAKDVDMCFGPNATEIPCTQLGDEFTCDDGPDTVRIRHDHLLSDLSSHTITIQTPLMTARKSKRYPIIRYDVETGKLTMNGKRCILATDDNVPPISNRQLLKLKDCIKTEFKKSLQQKTDFDYATTDKMCTRKMRLR